ncbi:YojF family protein [Aciduricibacillus chroicocephali]|uniref:YojF family protein n=1 Tax=Aciduricibacillus chroicocephali TaxID=3054939 RepID=A0ABY9KT25_9BACI|nr:YojF family protein [Bacillaceae bacterium 44XB]
MKPIELNTVQEQLDQFLNKPVYIHVETTNGAYASHFGDEAFNVGAYVRNAQVKYSQAKIVGAKGDSFRVGLKLEYGWVYAEGLTDWELFEGDKLLMAGHDPAGRLLVALEISETPFGTNNRRD